MTQTWRYIFRCNSHINIICTICIYVRCTSIGTSVSVCLHVDFRWSETGLLLGSAYLLENIYAGVLSWCCRDFVRVRVSSKFLFSPCFAFHLNIYICMLYINWYICECVSIFAGLKLVFSSVLHITLDGGLSGFCQGFCFLPALNFT